MVSVNSAETALVSAEVFNVEINRKLTLLQARLKFTSDLTEDRRRPARTQVEIIRPGKT